MSIEAYKAVWNNSKQRSGALVILLAIAEHANREGVCWPGVPRLARMGRMSERNAQRSIRRLEAAGEIKVFPCKGRSGTNLYRICLGDLIYGDENGTADDIRVAESVTCAAATCGGSVTQSVNESSTERTPIVPKGDDTDFWIKVSFDCFKQTRRPLPRHVLRALARAIPILEKKHADSLFEFYCNEPLDFKEPPYSSRKHSPERLILDLPRQLALAVQTCPPPKKRGYTIEDVHDYLTEKYPGCNLPNSLDDLDGPLWQHIQREVYDAMRERNQKSTDAYRD